VPEEARAGESPADMVVRLGLAKALAVQPEPPYSLVVGSDTVVTLSDGGQTVILGKPADRTELGTMVRRLGGREHSVYTSVAVRDASYGRTVWGAVRVGVRLRRLDEAELTAYCASGIGDDKAGGYAVQDRTFGLVESVSGCVAAAMGLPLCLLRQALAELGLRVPGDSAIAEGCGALTGLPCCLVGGASGPEIVAYGKEGC